MGKQETTIKNFYVTYGFGSNLANCYSVVPSVDYASARAEVDKVTGGAFAFIYDEDEFRGQAEKYGMTNVALQAQVMRP